MSTFRITPKDVGRTSMCRTAFLTARIIAYDPGPTNRPVKVQYSDEEIIWLFESGNRLFGKDSDRDLIAWADEPAINQVPDQVRPKDLRDEFAMVVSGHIWVRNVDMEINQACEMTANTAYMLADAMLKARGK